MTYHPGPSAAPVCPASGGASPRSARRPTAAAGAALGKNVSIAPRTSDHERNLSRFASKWAAANLLKVQDEKAAVALSHCGYVAFQSFVDLERNTATGRASFRNLKTCGRVFLCPCCSPRISNRRRDELNLLLSGARAAGLSVCMLTLTARHDRSMALAPFLAALKLAKRKLTGRQVYSRLPLVGSVTACEYTFGQNGHHPHYHVLLVLDAPASQAVGMVETLRSAWLTALASVGLSGNEAAFQVQDASAAANYIGKFGAADELALQGQKRGRNGSRGPWQLLDDARDGDAQAAAVWREYAAAFTGTRQLWWSRGLKARFGIGEASDDEVAAEAEPADVPSLETLRTWVSNAGWRQARRRRIALVQAAEAGSSLDAAEYGPTDALRWQFRGGDAVLEPPD